MYCVGPSVASVDSSSGGRNDISSSSTSQANGKQMIQQPDRGMVAQEVPSCNGQETPNKLHLDEKGSAVVDSLESTESLLQTTPQSSAEKSRNKQVPSRNMDCTERPTLVHGVSEWDFPSSVLDKSKFVFGSLREGTDAKSVVSDSTPKPKQTKQQHSTTTRRSRPARTKRMRYDEKTLEENVFGDKDLSGQQSVYGSPRNRRRINEDPTFEKKINPKANGVEFDKRFLSFARAPNGMKMEEKLVWNEETGKQHLSHDVKEAPLEMIPDFPRRSNKSRCRVGPMYQARIPRRGEVGENGIDWDAPGYDQIWDPKRAETAEREGQDIVGYFHQKGQQTDLCKTEFLMKLLHENNYDAKQARADSKKVQQFRGLYKLNRQRELEDDWCSHKDGKCNYADDEHTLVVCDKCGRAYHLECVSLDGVPDGQWFCPVCEQHFAGLSGSLPGVKTRKAKVSAFTSATTST